MCPDAKKSKLVKPDKTVYCPMSGKPIKAKDLIDVKWTEVKDPDNKKSMISREDRYQCAVTGDTLYNSTPCAVIRVNKTTRCIRLTNYLTLDHWPCGHDGVCGQDNQEGLDPSTDGEQPDTEGHHPHCARSNWLQRSQ